MAAYLESAQKKTPPPNGCPAAALPKALAFGGFFRSRGFFSGGFSGRSLFSGGFGRGFFGDDFRFRSRSGGGGGFGGGGGGGFSGGLGVFLGLGFGGGAVFVALGAFGVAFLGLLARGALLRVVAVGPGGQALRRPGSGRRGRSAGRPS
jgi:hypothetical protein